MMYIKDSYCISPQKTLTDKGISEYTQHEEIKYYAIEPDYSKFIPNSILRRMGKSVRMGVGAGLHVLPPSTPIDGILMASSNGAIEDCFKFLNQIITYNEGTLTPTHFVQGTPNAPAGQLALMSKSTGYNITHVSSGLAFEGALLDAILLMEEKVVNTVLLGAVEELSECHYVVHDKINHFKKEGVDANLLLESSTEGTVYGEGAVSFIFSSTPTESGVRIVDVGQILFPDQDEIIKRIIHFLDKNNFTPQDIDAVVVGLCGDTRYDHRYIHLINEMFNDQWIYTFKNLVGEYPTSAAFATWMSDQLLKGNPLPKEVEFRTSKKQIKRILIYNHYFDQCHGIILMEK
ncbi:MAG: beta-ketoacyl synthase chain length factor [Cyclobacteriaceae bacterium]|nr:beta-ketoacyl synthase chain length factor [Cyclobacteriaceae bacterium]